MLLLFGLLRATILSVIDVTTMVKLLLEFISENDLAIKVSNGKVICWLQKSQIRYFLRGNSGMADVEIPDWLAKIKELT